MIFENCPIAHLVLIVVEYSPAYGIAPAIEKNFSAANMVNVGQFTKVGKMGRWARWVKSTKNTFTAQRATWVGGQDGQ